MAYKLIVFCIFGILHQSIASCIGSPFNSGLGLAGNGLAGNGLAANGLAGNGLAANGLAGNGFGINGLAANGLAGNGFGINGFAGNGLGYNGYGCGGGVASTGGGFSVTSSSQNAPTGLSIISENVYEGNLAAGGSLPLLGTVAVEGTLPTNGVGAISYGCGDGAIGITSEAPVATGIAAPGAVFPPNSPVPAATNAAGAFGLVGNGLAGNGMGYNGLAYNGLNGVNGFNGLNGLGRFGLGAANCA